ncbi:SET domain-containing protein [Ditylenchus destructor]|uniref:[histone H3]-lysine(4) N-trimethyltransferase n=1 Tax=Ditylenchus destructor TaxID=166010 RepID=A0AAD4RBH9_9BILA|nr:SET domain-containing protein [Ditylenchus destructor]
MWSPWQSSDAHYEKRFGHTATNRLPHSPNVIEGARKRKLSNSRADSQIIQIDSTGQSEKVQILDGAQTINEPVTQNSDGVAVQTSTGTPITVTYVDSNATTGQVLASANAAANSARNAAANGGTKGAASGRRAPILSYHGVDGGNVQPTHLVVIRDGPVMVSDTSGLKENTVQYQIASSSNGSTRPVTIVQNVQPSRYVVVNSSQARSTPYQSYSPGGYAQPVMNVFTSALSSRPGQQYTTWFANEPGYRTTTSPGFPLSNVPFQTRRPNPNTVGPYVIPAVRRYGYRERIPTKFPLNSSLYGMLNTGTPYEKPMNGHQLASSSSASNIAYEKNRSSPVCSAREMRTTPLISQPILKEKTAPTSERGSKKGASNLVPDFTTFLSENLMPNATETSSPQKSVGSEEDEKDCEVKEEKQNRTERPSSCARILTVDEVRRKKYLSMQKEFMEKLRDVTCARTCITYDSWIASKRKRQQPSQPLPIVECSVKPSTTITPSSPACSSRIEEPVAPTTSNQCKKDMTFVVVEDILSDEAANASAPKPTVVKKERKKWTRRNPEEKRKPLRVLQRIGKKKRFGKRSLQDEVDILYGLCKNTLMYSVEDCMYLRRRWCMENGDMNVEQHLEVKPIAQKVESLGKIAREDEFETKIEPMEHECQIQIQNPILSSKNDIATETTTIELVTSGDKAKRDTEGSHQESPAEQSLNTSSELDLKIEIDDVNENPLNMLDLLADVATRMSVPLSADLNTTPSPTSDVMTNENNPENDCLKRANDQQYSSPGKVSASECVSKVETDAASIEAHGQLEAEKTVCEDAGGNLLDIKINSPLPSVGDIKSEYQIDSTLSNSASSLWNGNPPEHWDEVSWITPKKIPNIQIAPIIHKNSALIPKPFGEKTFESYCYNHAKLRDVIPLPAGCARAQGFFKLSPAHKSRLRQLVKDTLNNEDDTTFDPLATQLTAVGPEDGRQVRHKIVDINNTERLQTQLLQMPLSERVAMRNCMESNELKKIGPEKFRQKELKFSRSNIHGWGLFAMETIPPDEPIIEYVGEVVRHSIADVREKKYEKQGMGSSYMFRINADWVVDATRSGNYARFINHCCRPNCYARIVSVSGTNNGSTSGVNKRIIVYSKSTIEKGEELTYDYKFDRELDSDERIPCMCSIKGCRKFLN